MKPAPAPAGEVVICTTCADAAGPAPLEALQARLDAAGLGACLRVRGHACLNLCDAPRAMALQGPGRATMLLAGVSIGQDMADIVATCRAWLAADAGWIADARPCGRLRFCLRGRVPAPGSATPVAEAPAPIPEGPAPAPPAPARPRQGKARR